MYSVTSYSLPKFHKGKTYYVAFQCFDPVEGKMRRKKYHLDGIKSKREREKRATELIANITQRLREGWNVWAKAETSRQYTAWETIVGYYTDFVEKMFRMGAIKQNTYLGYKSYFFQFRLWTQGLAVPLVYAYQLDRRMVTDFLDHVLLDKDVSAQTRNNYKGWLSVFCAWMVEKGFLTENPTEGIKNLPVEKKVRDALPPGELARLREFLLGTNRHFLLACMMEYYTLIRPIELTFIKIGDIRVKELKVVLSGEFTKNRRDAAVALNEELVRMMIDLGVFDHASGEFLFGGRDFRPGPKQLDSRAFREEFQRVRKRLGWPAKYQFYSLKDTGIRDLANEAGIVVARDQARHSDISTTNKYLKADQMAVHEEAKRFRGGL